MTSFCFVGSKKIGLNCFEKLAKNFPDKMRCAITIDDIKDTRSKFYEFKDLSKQLNVDLHVPSSRSEAENLIKEVKPDFVFVCGWYWLFSNEIIRTPKGGFFGIHNSLLPKYRGQAPLVWSLLNSDPEVGATLFQFSDGMDTGDVFHQWKIQNDDNHYISEILEKIEYEVSSSISQIWKNILSGKLQGNPQNPTEATYSCKRIPEDGLINWDQDANEILRQIRTLNHPYPLSFTNYEGHRYYIEKAERFPYQLHGVQGSILYIKQDELVVACGRNSGIRITKGFFETKNNSPKLSISKKFV